MARRFDYSVPNLLRAWKASRTADAYGRDRRREIVRQYVGPHWNEEGADTDIPVNLLSLYVQVVSRSLIAKTPRVLLQTFDPAQRAACDAAEAWANRELVRTNAGTTFRRVVTDALFGVGICRVALARAADAAQRGWGPRGGEAMVSRIDREDFAYDHFAGDFSECAWIGHKYRAPLEAVKDDKTFRRSRKDVPAARRSPYDEYGVESVNVLGRGYYGDREYDETAELWEFYDPRRKLILTFESDPSGSPVPSADGKPLGEQPWVGPETGPYHFLGYLWVPGNAMLKGPLQDLYDPHCAANQFYRKAIAAVERLKEVTVYADEEDAKRVRDADDGGTAFVQDPRQIQTVLYGGQHVQAVYGLAQAMRELFDFQGGNLALLGGRAQQAKTLGQEEILNQNAYGSIADMQETTVLFTNAVCRAFLWYGWKHPFLEMQAPVSVPGVEGATAVRTVFPRGAVAPNAQPRSLRRDADFDALDVRVDSFSLAPRTPGQMVQTLRTIWKEDIVPLVPAFMAQGVSPDFVGYIKKLGRYLDDPDFEELLTVREPPASGGGSVRGQGEPPMPTATERTYNRVSGSEKTDTGQGRSQVTQLLSGNDQGGAGAEPNPFAGVMG